METIFVCHEHVGEGHVIELGRGFRGVQCDVCGKPAVVAVVKREDNEGSGTD